MAKKKVEAPVPIEIIVIRLTDIVKSLADVTEKITKRLDLMAWDINRLKKKAEKKK